MYCICVCEGVCVHQSKDQHWWASAGKWLSHRDYWTKSNMLPFFSSQIAWQSFHLPLPSLALSPSPYPVSLLKCYSIGPKWKIADYFWDLPCSCSRLYAIQLWNGLGWNHKNDSALMFLWISAMAGKASHLTRQSHENVDKNFLGIFFFPLWALWEAVLTSNLQLLNWLLTNCSVYFCIKDMQFFFVFLTL